MKNWSLILILVLMVPFLHSQSEWLWQNPIPQGNNLFNVQFVNSNTAYAVGGAGIVMKTTDSGSNWNLMEYAGGSAKIMRSLYFIDENEGWAGGYDGKLLHTTNAGAQWDSVTGHSIQIITGVAFPDPSLGIIVTSYQNSLCCASIYQTTDGGSTWSSRSLPSGGDYNLYDVAFANDTLGMAVGLFGTILRTTDGGSTWQLQNSGTTENLYSIDHVGDNLWMIAGNGRIIIKSTDEGLSWTESYHGLTNYFRGIDMVDENTAYVCGYEGEIQKTTDGGQTWSLQQSNTLNHLFGISFTDVSTGIAVGLYGEIVRTTNGGLSWDVVSQGATQDLQAVDFPDSQTGFSCGAEGILLKTSDLGGTWQTLNSGVFQTLYGLSFVSTGTGTAVGDAGIIIRTTNGGQNWVSQSSGIAAPGRLTDVSFVNNNIGFAVGYNSASLAAIRKTTDGGNTWLNSQPGIDDLLYSVDFYNENHGIVVGGNGAIIYTTDSGDSWQDRSLGFGYSFSSVQMVNDSFAVAAGYNYNVFPAVGVIYITTDGGDSWTDRSAGNSKSFVSAYFINENDGIVCGSYGVVYRTTDGGITWQNELSGTDNTLNGVTITEAGQAFITGEGGTILGYNGVVPVELTDFKADVYGIKVVLNWITASETNNKGFEIQRLKFSPDIKVSDHFTSRNKWDILGFVDGNGTTSEMHSYSYRDVNVEPGKYLYRLRQIDFDGSSRDSKTIEAEVVASLIFSLSQNYPNPFNPSTIIRFTIPVENTFTTLKVYNSLGEEISVLVNDVLSAGNHEVTFDAEGLPGGVYFYELSAGRYNKSMKMVLLK